jgi:hypothetical protein
MRLGNAEDARTAAQHIGTRQRLRVAGFTDSVGDAVGASVAEPYTSTVNSARSRLSAQALDDAWEPGMPDGAALVDGIASSTGWGRTARAADADDAAGDEGSRQGVREFVVERHQLQQLPPTAMIFTHAMATGRQILLVDANPAIMTLPTAHSQEYEEFLREQGPGEAPSPRVVAGGHPESTPHHVEPGHLKERTPPVRVGRHAAPPGTRTKSRHAAPPPAGAPPNDRLDDRLDDHPNDHTNDRLDDHPNDRPDDRLDEEEPSPPPNLGPPPDRLDFRRKKKH